MRSPKGWKTSVLYRYIASYISLVLIACCLVTLGSCYTFALRLDKEIEKHQVYQLSLIAEDLDRRYESMESIALDIAISADFKPIFFKRSSYYETYLLTGLSRYSGQTLMDNGFFLLYDQYDSIYTKDAKYTFSTYFNQILGMKNTDSLPDTIRSTQTLTILQGSPLKNNEQFWCLPIRLLGVQSPSCNATLVFIVPSSAYEDEFFRAVGTIPGSISIWLNGQQIASIGENPPTEATEKTIAATTPKVGFTLIMLPEAPDFFTNVKRFAENNLLLLSCIFLLLLSLGTLFAYRSYRPIKRVYKKQTDGGVKTGVHDELCSLEITLDRYAAEKQQATLQIDRQLQLLRRQMIALLLSGREHDPQNETARSLGITFEHPCFFTMAVCSQAGSEQTEARLAPIIKQINSSDISCYTALSQEHSCVAVLFNIAQPDLRELAARTLIEASRREGMLLVCGSSACENTPNRLKLSFMEAISALNAIGGGSELQYYEDIIPSDDPLAGYSAALSQMIETIRSGNAKKAQDEWYSLVQYIELHIPSIPLQLYQCSRVLDSLIQIAGHVNMPLQREQLSWIHMSASIRSFKEGISELIWEICDAQKAANGKTSEGYAQELLQYVDEHYLEYTMSLDLLAERFSISPSQISRIFKVHTGEAFKDYIVRRRIDSAQQLIVQKNIPVSELCTQIGYINVSHFIKIFKARIGLTPAAYRDSMQTRVPSRDR